MASFDLDPIATPLSVVATNKIADGCEPAYGITRWMLPKVLQFAALYARYEALANGTDDVSFVGRLATYKYYNMGQCVGQALATFAKIREDVSQAA